MIGGLRHRVTIQEETKTEDTGGGFALAWADVSTMWCDVVPATGREVFQAQQLQKNVSHKITTRYRTDVTTANRLLWGARTFNVRSVITVSERNRYTVILADEGPAT